jgi:hypothetical protein
MRRPPLALALPRTPRTSTRRALLVAVLVALVTFAPIATTSWSAPASASTGRHLTVAPWGSDSATGSSSAPYATIQHAMHQLRAGDTLTVRGGTYRERVVVSFTDITPGRADAPITVQAAPGERPVIEGRLRLSGADHWTVNGINVTWSNANTANEHMVVFRGGTNWRFTNAEIWGARSYAAILVSDNARNFSLDHLHVHDTHPTNGANQDHLIYVNNGHHGNGTIERNILAHSTNGRGVKLGPGSLTDPGTNNITIRYNTFHNNTGPSNIQLSGSTSNNTITHNLMVRSGSAAVTAWELSGTNNVARDNAAWDATRVVNTTTGLNDGGNNTMTDPRFADPANGDYRPTNTAATPYGHLAGIGTTDPDDSTTDPGDSTTDPDDSTTDPGDSTTDPGDSTTDPDDSTTDPGDSTIDPGEAPPVVVSARYSHFGGKANRNHLDVDLKLTQDTHDVTGQPVTVALHRDGSHVSTDQGTTDSAGSVTFKHRNVGPGCYIVTVTTMSGVSHYEDASTSSCG